MNSTVESMEKASNLLFQKFKENHMEVNGEKYVLLSTNNGVLVNIGSAQI